MKPQLYQPEKYRVLVGEGNGVGLCTAWNEPELIFKRSASVRKRSALVGTLYSRQGVNIILRNLALNPSIRTLFLWANGPLSNTKFGVLGWSVLKKLWEEGVDNEGNVSGTQFKVEPEIERPVLEKVRKNVTLVDVSSDSFDAVEKRLEKTPAAEPYMDPISFPDSVAEEVDTFPSEEVGWLVRGSGVVDTWTRVLDRIMRYGTIKGTQYGYQQRELIGVTWVVQEEDPDSPNLSLAADWPNELREVTGATKGGLEEYRQIFLSPEPPKGIVYTYGNRLMRYPDGSGKTIDQVAEAIVRNLKESPDSRRAVATTMVPALDAASKEPPCVTQIQALQVKGHMHLLVTVRSHDIFKAAIPNAFGLRSLQKSIVSQLGFELGSLQITSQSAHIYEQDWENALKVVRCRFWDREPNLAFDPETQRDLRGNVIISIGGGKITALLQGLEGQELGRFEGTSAKEVGAKLTFLELLGRSDHIMDVAMELQKAEIALKRNLNYQQDKLLLFN